MYFSIYGNVLFIFAIIVKGFIKRFHSFTAVDNKQNEHVFFPDFLMEDDIKFISSEAFSAAVAANKRIGRKSYTEYEAEDLDGYIYDYANFDGATRYYETLTVNSLNLTVHGKLFVLLKEICKNGDRLYKFYIPEGGPTLESYMIWDNMEYHTIEYPVIVFNGDGRKGTVVDDINIEKTFKTRCPEVVTRWNDGTYTDVVDNKESKLNKLARFASKVNEAQADATKRKAFDDYINTCANKE